MKRTKKFNQEWAEAIALLPQNLQQSITEAIRSYQNDGILPTGLHPVAQALFIVIKPTIDIRTRRSAYQKERRQRRNTSCVSIAEHKPVVIPEAPKAAEPQDAVPLSESLKDTVDSQPLKDTCGEKRSAMPRQSNRFLRQVEKARHAGCHRKRHKNTGSRRE